MKIKLRPVVTKQDGPGAEYKETHPAYAQISASRVSGAATLYGSDFISQHYVTISICKSDLNRGLSNDWPFPREELIEVSLTEAQWATFVSSMNMGSGVQCTLERFNGQGIPDIDMPTDRRTQFSQEVKETFEEAKKQIQELKDQINGMKISQKAKDELLSKISMVSNNIAPNVKFVADQFDEHMAKTVEHAKVEVATYIQTHIQRAGITAIQNNGGILTLGESNPHQGNQGN